MASVRALGNLPTTMRSISTLARLHLLQGRLRQAAVTIEQATQLVPKQGGLHTLLNGADYYFIMGDLLREWNQLNRAEQHLAQGMDLVKETMSADAEMIMRGYLALARLQQARGESTQAFATLDAFAQMAHQHAFAPILVAQGAARTAACAFVRLVWHRLLRLGARGVGLGIPAHGRWRILQGPSGLGKRYHGAAQNDTGDDPSAQAKCFVSTHRVAPALPRTNFSLFQQGGDRAVPPFAVAGSRRAPRKCAAGHRRNDAKWRANSSVSRL